MPRQPARCSHEGCNAPVDCTVQVRAGGKDPSEYLGSRTLSYCSEHGEQMYYALLQLMEQGVPDRSVTVPAEQDSPNDWPDPEPPVGPIGRALEAGARMERESRRCTVMNTKTTADPECCGDPDSCQYDPPGLR